MIECGTTLHTYNSITKLTEGSFFLFFGFSLLFSALFSVLFFCLVVFDSKFRHKKCAEFFDFFFPPPLSFPVCRCVDCSPLLTFCLPFPLSHCRIYNPTLHRDNMYQSLLHHRLVTATAVLLLFVSVCTAAATVTATRLTISTRLAHGNTVHDAPVVNMPSSPAGFGGGIRPGPSTYGQPIRQTIKPTPTLNRANELHGSNGPQNPTLQPFRKPVFAVPIFKGGKFDLKGNMKPVLPAVQIPGGLANAELLGPNGIIPTHESPEKKAQQDAKEIAEHPPPPVDGRAVQFIA
jgi:hypothetical protein